jgi:phosphatidylglycerophosphatase A
MTSELSPAAAPIKKPRISYLIATVFGLGYLKPGPGTWGSLFGVAISIFLTWIGARWWDPRFHMDFVSGNFWANEFSPTPSTRLIVIVVAIVGVIAAGRVERHSGKHDPQFVVIDEVSGQLIALSLPLYFYRLNWKSWLLGFILFRVFDIWKPFPARQAESLPGGWGIMADDWIAGIYAALGLWAARALGLLA